jgi:hypothetical protein
MHGVISVPLVSFRVEAAHRPSLWMRLGRRSRQSKRFSPLSSWVRFSLWTRVKRVSQHSAESRGFSGEKSWVFRLPLREKVGRVG